MTQQSFPCPQAHYAVVVESTKEPEIYQLDEHDCPTCLQVMADKLAALAEMFRAKRASLEGPRR